LEVNDKKVYMNLLNKYLIIGTATILLVACGGGSSSSSTTSATPSTPTTIESFTSWSATTANVPVAMTNGSSSSVDLLGNISQSDSSGSATFTRDANNSYTLISPSASAGNSAIFSAALGDTLQSSFSSTNTTALNKAQTTIGLFGNPSTFSYNYQTYGAWGSYGIATGDSFALSDGSASSASAISTTGGLTYTGGSTGYFVDTNKFSYITNSTMVANLSFNTRTFVFTTTGTVIQGAPNGNVNTNTNLNITGVMTYIAGTNNFTGTVTTTSGMTGKINGKFYGPGTKEIGVTYALYGAAIGTLVGSFGGKY
jgi:hypothetical protein